MVTEITVKGRASVPSVNRMCGEVGLGVGRFMD